ncbi:MAG: HAMP domain-containing histidine kinase [Clostridiales bacterium]|nr:HAMP domain-containing histidine kinase [Clostridiales bacterium]
MKSLSKIFARYLATAVMIVLITLFFNLILYVVLAFRLIQSSDFTARNSREIAAELSSENGTVSLSDKGHTMLEQGYSFAMLLDDKGQILWRWQLPSELDHPYTARDIARFSRWYLDDYPVTERITDYGLLVIGQEKGSVWKYCVSESMDLIDQLPSTIALALLANLLFILLFALFLGFLFYRSLRVIAIGIERLSNQKAIRLPERGMTEILAKQLNLTSSVLESQKERLQKRDDARTSWISGVSHDIRTPLSLIMGYASTLTADPSLSGEQRRQAELIQQQSIQIKRLIEDLNLTSRLEYGMQPLRVSEFSPAALLRRLVTDFYNQGLSPSHVIDLYIDPETEHVLLTGDENLLERAFRNLIQNSIRHNPGGCSVTVTVKSFSDQILFQVSDDGCGIPDAVLQILEQENHTAKETPHRKEDAEKAPHIMGLRIVLQIVRAHGWNLQFTDSHTIRILS